MRILVLSLILISALSCFAQESDSYASFHRAYKNKEGVTSLSLPAGLVRLFIDQQEEQELNRLFKKADRISFLVSEANQHDLSGAYKRYISGPVYKEIMVLNEGPSTLTFSAKEENGIIKELIMSAQEPGNFSVMCLEGNFSKEDMQHFGKQIDGGRPLEILTH